MTIKKMAFLMLLGSISTWATAMSKPYDAVAGLTLRSGKPCIFSQEPLPQEPPDYMKDMGLAFRVFSESPSAPGYLWDAWFKVWKKPLPDSASTCVAYGEAQSDVTRHPAKPLPLDTPLSFDMDGQYGRHNVRFCLRKDSQGKRYLSTAVRKDGVSACTADPLKNSHP